MNPNDKVMCVNNSGYHNLTEGKKYQCLYGIEPGIFEDRPYITVIGDNGKKVSAHAYRFVLWEPCNEHPN